MLRARTGSPILLLCILLAAGCSPDKEGVQLTDPTADAQTSGTGPVQEVIDVLFPPPGLRQAASAKLASIQAELEDGNTAEAQLQAADLSAFLNTQLNNGKLLDPNGSGPPTRSEAVALLTCELQKEVSPGSITADCDQYAEDVGDILDRGGAIGIVGPAGGTVVTAEGREGISVPAGATLIPRVITIDPIPVPLTAKDGPLPEPRCIASECEPIDQYPLFGNFIVDPAEGIGTPDFLIPVTVGLCHLDDGGDYAPTVEVEQRLRIGHELVLGVEETELEVLAKTDAPFLDCADFTSDDLIFEDNALGPVGSALRSLASAARPVLLSLLPEAAHAAMARCCLGGLATKLSPFGAVDPGQPLQAQDPALESDLASPGTTDPAEVLFTNHTDETVRVYWIDNNGIRTVNGQLGFYATLEPGRSYVQQTFVGHFWVLTNENDEGLAIYEAIDGLGFAEFTGPVGQGPVPPPEQQPPVDEGPIIN